MAKTRWQSGFNRASKAAQDDGSAESRNQRARDADAQIPLALPCAQMPPALHDNQQDQDGCRSILRWKPRMVGGFVGDERKGNP